MKIKESTRRYAEGQAATATAPTRITVRLKPDVAERLAAASRELGQSVTQIVESALEKQLQRASAKPRQTLLDSLEKNDLLGCVDLGPEASVRVKEDVSEHLERKYPHH